MEDYTCVNCLEPITNPVCKSCFIKHIKTWINEAPILDNKQKEIIRKIQNLHVLDTPSNLSCIICGSDEVSICPYCFFLEVSRILKKCKIDNAVIEGFLEIFNYRQGHDEYII